MDSDSRCCPKCGEDNPEEALLCWACYTPLASPEKLQNDGGALREDNATKRLEINIHQDAADVLRLTLLVSSLLSWLASGYVPRRRGVLIGTGIACLVALVGWFKWDERVAARQSALAEGEDPTARILDTILLYAVRDGASQVRLRAGVRVWVHYLIDGEWHEQMHIPAYVWEPLSSLLIEKSDSWKQNFTFEADGKPFELWPEFTRERDEPVETVTLTLHTLENHGAGRFVTSGAAPSSAPLL
ncbi:hypothetical protein EON80_32600 [bacterium]|nr:MAG: hypothetical protein EON80_32600 [bacterium]